MTPLLKVVLTLGLLLLVADAAVAMMPPVGSPPAPASNLSPPKAFIGMLITFFCFFLVIGINLIPSKRSEAK